LEEDVVEMQMEPEPQRGPLLTPSLARILFVSLAGIAGLALLIAVLAVALAPDGAVTILVVALVILAIVVLAEIVLLLVARPRNA
jgi:hypothetical protein